MFPNGCLSLSLFLSLFTFAKMVWIQIRPEWNSGKNVSSIKKFVHAIESMHMGQYQLLLVLAARLSPLNIDHSRDLPVEISDINYTEKYTNL